MFTKEALNTIKANWLELKLVLWFGKRTIHADGNRIITIATLFGKEYLISSVGAE